MRILFVCHGNICRSPMAEFIMKDMVARRGLAGKYRIESCATSTEEIGCDIYPPARTCLIKHGVHVGSRSARQITSEDYDRFDMIIAMDNENLYWMKRIIKSDPEGKISLLLSHCGSDGEVDDPWYTGDFDRTFYEIQEDCAALLDSLEKKE